MTPKTTGRFGAAIQTLRNDIAYYESLLDSDKELAEARIEEYRQAIEILEQQD